MKIAQITYSGFGGLGSVVFSLVQADINNTHDWIIGFLGDQKLDRDYQNLSENLKLPYASFTSKPRNPLLAWKSLFGWLSKQKPEAIICHTLNPVLVCRIYAWIYRIPLIAVEHTSNSIKPRNEKITSFISMLLADRIVVLTDLYLIQMKATFKSLLRSKKIVIIQNGIDLDFFYPVDKNAPCKQLVIGMAARFTPSKKQDFLVSVLERIYELEPNINLKLTFAGNGTELNRVKRIAESSSVARNITFEGLIEEKQIAPWMRNLDIYVHATEGETLSTSILQSMGCGIPIIASDVTGVANLLGHQNNLGYCIINDKDSFAKAIIKLLKDPHDQSRIANNVRKHAELYFGNTEMLNRYIKLIRSII